MSTWYSKHVEESNNIRRINNIQCITLVVLYGQVNGTYVYSQKHNYIRYSTFTINKVQLRVSAIKIHEWSRDLFPPTIVINSQQPIQEHCILGWSRLQQEIVVLLYIACSAYDRVF